MLLSFKHPIDLPVEIILLLLDHLSYQDVKTIRLVCLELSRIACPLLFRSITVSAQQSHIHRFLNIVRDRKLCKMVQRVIWQELPFQSPSNAKWRDPPQEILVAYLLPETDSQEQPTLQERDQAQDFRSKVRSLREHRDCTIANIKACLAALTEGCSAMSGLKTVISTDARVPGNTMDTVLDPLTSFDGQHLLPLSDAVMRLLEFPERLIRRGILSNCVGFFCMLEALAITGVPVENLITERTSGLLKHGIQPVNPFLADDFEHRFAKAFRHLRKISLCLDCPDSTFNCGLYTCLQRAEQLEHLEISETHLVESLTNELQIFAAPIRFPKLHPLVLEKANLRNQHLSRFIVRHAPSLTTVALWDCYISGSWRDVIQVLADAKNVHFESFILKSPRDEESYRCHVSEGQIAPRVNSQDVLRFINEGGSNPYANRRWIRLDDDDTLSNASEYSDISGWAGHASKYGDGDFDNVVDEDPDGPEYNSDYDFDAESESEPGTESQGKYIASGSMNDDDRFYYESWSWFTSV